jgi:hypothetical protein
MPACVCVCVCNVSLLFILLFPVPGFWERRIAQPFASCDAEAVKLVHHLCDGILMRHSKTQRVIATGDPILTLPSTETELVGVNLYGEFATTTTTTPADDDATHTTTTTTRRRRHPVPNNDVVVIREDDDAHQRLVALANALVLKFVELTASKIDDAVVERKEAESSTRGGAGGWGGTHLYQKQLSLLHLMRKVCTSASLLNGGAGCVHQLSILDALNRIAQGSYRVDQAALAEEVSARVVSCRAAMDMLLMTQQASRPSKRKMPTMVSERPTTTTTTTLKTTLENACDVFISTIQLRSAQVAAKTKLARLRWRYATECVCSGFYGAKLAVYGEDVVADDGRPHRVSASQRRVSTRLRSKMNSWLAVLSKKQEVSTELCNLEKSLQGLDFEAICANFAADKTQEQIDGLGISDADGLVAMVLDPVSRALNALEREERDIRTVGWRHREGAYLWRGKVQWGGGGGVSTQCGHVDPAQDEQEQCIVHTSEKLKDTVASGKSMAHISKLKLQLTEAFRMYADNVKRGVWSVEIKHGMGCVMGEPPTLKAKTTLFDPTSKAPSDAAHNPKLRSSLSTEMAALKRTVELQHDKLQQLLPYLSLHWGAMEKGLERSDSVQQSGICNVQSLMRGESPTCSICYCPVEKPTFTRCGHIACRACLLMWLQAAPVRLGAEQSPAGNKRAPCMMCRQPFSVEELIEVDPSLDDDEANDAQRLLSTEEARDWKEIERRFLGLLGGSSCVSTFCEEDFRAFSKIFTKACEEEVQAREGMHLSFPSLPSSLLTALKVATGIVPASSSRVSCSQSRSPKMVALVGILKEIKLRGEKVVIFSQQSESVNHVCHILREEKILHTRIIKADREGLQKAAVHTFMTQDVCLAMVLHAGAGAAGLTLTAAQNVILLEPFLKRGDELQAVARVHRIGQTKKTKVYILFMKGTTSIFATYIVHDVSIFTFGACNFVLIFRRVSFAGTVEENLLHFQKDQKEGADPRSANVPVHSSYFSWLREKRAFASPPR